MARITNFSVESAHPRVTVDAHISPAEPITIGFTGDIWARLTTDEAVQLRDDLSRAITEAAQQHAQGVAA